MTYKSRFNQLIRERHNAPLVPAVFGFYAGLDDSVSWIAVITHVPMGINAQANTIPALTAETAKIIFERSRTGSHDWVPVAVAKTAHDALGSLIKKMDDYQDLTVDLHATLIWYLSTTMGARAHSYSLYDLRTQLVIPSGLVVMSANKPTDKEFENGTAWEMWSKPFELPV